MFPPPFGRVDSETNSFLEQTRQTCCELGQTRDSAIELASLEGFSFLTQNIANDRHFLFGNKKSHRDEVPLLLHLMDQGSLHVILLCDHTKLTIVSLCAGVVLFGCVSLCLQFSPLVVLVAILYTCDSLSLLFFVHAALSSCSSDLLFSAHGY